MLKRIGTAARMEIENLMDTKVNLKLWVKSAPGVERQRYVYEELRI